MITYQALLVNRMNEEVRTSAYFVYVHLGVNPSPTLIEFSLQAQANLPKSKAILVTDHPENWSAFPGEVIKHKPNNQFKGMAAFKKRHKELKSIANGYWVFTLQRLFALDDFMKFAEDDIPIVHFESDVQSFITEPILTQMVNQLHSIHVPRFGEQTGIASTVFIKNKNQLRDFLYKCDRALSEKNDMKSDMELLGNLLNSGEVEELSSGRLPHLSSKIFLSDFEVIFDGAGIGQYLFGQDPLHTNNRRISGFQNPEHSIKFVDAKWQIEKIFGTEYVVFEYEKFNYLIASLHVHSKYLLPKVSTSSKVWIRSIGEANGTISREIGDYVPDLIHSQKISYLNRIRIAKKNGIVKTINRRIRANRE